jgi:predicted aminopeptidase
MKMTQRALLACAAVAGLTACSPVYVLRAGYEEAKILSRRSPIARVIEDPATSEAVRRKLELVLQARDFAEHGLGLDAGDSYTTYSWVESDTLLLVLSGSRKDRFEAITWWFPIVGHVPYKGFFDFPEAHAAAEELRRQGFDTNVRPSGAFSTLGWFNDPLLNTLLRYGDVSLASTVVHEITHNTLFVPSQVAFNESYANFAGDRGAILFFCSRDGQASENCLLAERVWADNLVYGAFITSFIAELRALYARADLSSEEKIAGREVVFRSTRARFETEVAPRLQTRAYTGFADMELNNATLIGINLYYERLDLFEQVYQRYGGDLAAALRAIEGAAAARPDAPFAAVEGLLPIAVPTGGSD